MPDLWDTNPDHVFDTPDEQPDPAANGPDHSNEVRLKDQRGNLRPPAYILIALVIALVAILLLIAGVLFAPRQRLRAIGLPLQVEAGKAAGRHGSGVDDLRGLSHTERCQVSPRQVV